MVFKSRNEIPINTITAVINIEFTGSPFFDVLARALLFGKMPFSAKASKIRGAPIKDPKADESVAPNKPASTIGL